MLPASRMRYRSNVLDSSAHVSFPVCCVVRRRVSAFALAILDTVLQLFQSTTMSVENRICTCVDRLAVDSVSAVLVLLLRSGGARDVVSTPVIPGRALTNGVLTIACLREGAAREKNSLDGFSSYIRV